MKFSDVAGSADISVEHAVAHIQSWFRPEDLVCLVGLKDDSMRGKGKNSLSQFLTAQELVSDLQSERGYETLQSLSLDPDGTRWNLYVCASSVDHESTSVSRRGGVENVKAMPGVYADLDIKSGSFSSFEEIWQWLRGFPRPSLVINTGSGGCHAYWKTERPLEPDEAKLMQRQWWSYVRHMSGDRHVDKLVDTSRLLRLAGSVRWPKPGEQSPPTLATVVYRSNSVLTLDQLSELTSDPWSAYESKIRRTQQADAQRRLEADSLAQIAFDETNRWSLYAAIARVEETFTEMVSWDEILEPEGWMFLREDSEGRREFARPGRGEKSATVDWPESPDVMSLLSSSEETGLADLKEAGITLTKYRVALRLWFDDDENAMVNWVLERSR